jgi:hypothetical protein
MCKEVSGGCLSTTEPKTEYLSDDIYSAGKVKGKVSVGE